jgi:hypothetical protein
MNAPGFGGLGVDDRDAAAAGRRLPGVESALGSGLGGRLAGRRPALFAVDVKLRDFAVREFETVEAVASGVFFDEAEVVAADLCPGVLIDE